MSRPRRVKESRGIMFQRLTVFFITITTIGCSRPDPIKEAKKLQDQGRYEEAAVIYQSVFQSLRNHEKLIGRAMALNAVMDLSVCQIKLNQHGEAVVSLTNSIQLATSMNEEAPGYTPMPLFATMYRARAAQNKKAGNLEAARQDFASALAIEQEIDRKVKAIEQFEDMIRTYPLE